MAATDSCGRLLPKDDRDAKELLDAFRGLESNAYFASIKRRIAERLSEVNEHNLTRGTENPYTEGQAWKWFLNIARAASDTGEKLVIELAPTRA